MFEPGYIGGKSGAGVFHRIIGEMPPHSVYVEPFFGSGAIFWKKRPAAASVIIDRSGICIPKVKLPGVRAIVGDALEILPTLALPSDALVYADPPYLLSTRNNRAYYEFEMTDADHLRLLEVVKALPCRVMISGYWSQLYVDQLQDWRGCRFTAMTHGGPRTEHLWCNFPEPDVLHDWRFAPRGYREALYFKRRSQRWLAKLSKMSARQRGYLLDSIEQRYPRAAISARPPTPDLILSLFPGTAPRVARPLAS